MNRVRASASLTLWVSLMVTACGGDGLRNPGGIMGPTPTVTFQELQAEIFTPRCAFAGCHLGAAAPLGLDLSSGLSYANLVGVPSGELPVFLRVDPGNSADSYLFMKLDGDSRIAFAQMPLVGGPLSASDLARVGTWIDEGALDN